MKPTILIPAYEPDEKLVKLLRELSPYGFENIVIVNDGSHEACATFFEQAKKMGCHVIAHDINRGKGRALKTGMQYCLDHHLDGLGIITADADGQHSAHDISRIADAMMASPESFVLGVREFKGKVPLKSRLGNSITRKIFMYINGVDVRDTQTGLRGIPHDHVVPYIAISGEKYEYEINMLLSACHEHIHILQLGIETIYIENNRTSHFHAFRDSIRIYGNMLLFSLSSLISTAVDYAVFALMWTFLPPHWAFFQTISKLLLCQIVSRGLSALVNYYVNCRVVFKNKSAGFSSLIKYAILCTAVMFSAYGLILFMNDVLHFNVYVSKLIADNLMFLVGFSFQRDYVFGNKPIFKKRKTV